MTSSIHLGRQMFTSLNVHNFRVCGAIVYQKLNMFNVVQTIPTPHLISTHFKGSNIYY